jgi:3-mercaptopyruvate sulfurtransferase SseA
MPAMGTFRHASLLAALTFVLSPLAQAADAISAAQARLALADGAVAWDVREAAAAHLPGSARADLAAWRAGGGVAALAAAVSAAGIDLSRDVVVYGLAGDERARALVAALQAVASGRVVWLVGGIDEWQAAGLPTVAQADKRLPVPQRLVRFGDAPSGDRPAAPTLRRSLEASAPATLAAR